VKIAAGVAREAVRKHLGGIGAALVVVALIVAGALEPLELGALNLLFEVRGARPPRAPIVIVNIDEESFTELNQPWPFPRAMHAQLIDRLSAGKPLLIALDLIFDSPSAYGPADDAALGAAIARAGNVVLAAAPTETTETFGAVKTVGEASNWPIPVLAEGAKSVASIVLRADADSRVRRAPVHPRATGGLALPFLAAELHRLAVAAGVPGRPLPRRDPVLINFRGPPNTFPWVPYVRVLPPREAEGERDLIEPGAFEGMIVLVGPTSPVLHDLFPTAFARAGSMPGVEIHANAIETFLRGDAVREVPEAVTAVVAVLAALLGSALVVRLHALRAFLVAVLGWVALTVLGYLAFAYADVWLRGMAGSLALVLGYGATVVENFVREQREKRRLSQFFSPAVLNEVVRSRDGHALTSSRRTITVLFSDIRGFTSISERLPPERVAEMLQEYLSEMTEIVFQHGGTVDKYIGDCVMALYNAPLEDAEHAVKAIRTGLAFQEKAHEVSARWEERLGARIRNGVGINTGEAVVGTLGSRQRLEYTAIGDTVNLASRLEGLTKEYGTGIIISEFTHALVKGQFLTRELGSVAVKGKALPVKIFAVLPSDIRKYPRTAMESAARLTAIAGGRVVSVSTRNVSEGGLGIAGLPPELPVGARVYIKAEGGALPRAVSGEATIAWRHEDLAGLAFLAVDPETGVSLERAVTSDRAP
jgi:adenylate cyclase